MRVRLRPAFMVGISKRSDRRSPPSRKRSSTSRRRRRLMPAVVRGQGIAHYAYPISKTTMSFPPSDALASRGKDPWIPSLARVPLGSPGMTTSGRTAFLHSPVLIFCHHVFDSPGGRPACGKTSLRLRSGSPWRDRPDRGLPPSLPRHGCSDLARRLHASTTATCRRPSTFLPSSNFRRHTSPNCSGGVRVMPTVATRVDAKHS